MTSGWVQPVELTKDQKDDLLRKLNRSRRPKLRDPAMQAKILQRIEGALTYLANQTVQSETYEPFDRVSDFSRSIHDALKQIERLKEHERDSFELLDCDIDRLQNDMAKTATAAVRVMSGLKLGPGDKYGKAQENKSRFLADQLADFWLTHLELPTGHNSVFRKFFEVVCGQVELPVLGRDALDGVLNSAGKPTG